MDGLNRQQKQKRINKGTKIERIVNLIDDQTIMTTTLTSTSLVQKTSQALCLSIFGIGS
jgi:hypothetical protein